MFILIIRCSQSMGYIAQSMRKAICFTHTNYPKAIVEIGECMAGWLNGWMDGWMDAVTTSPALCLVPIIVAFCVWSVTARCVHTHIVHSGFQRSLRCTDSGSGCRHLCTGRCSCRVNSHTRQHLNKQRRKQKLMILVIGPLNEYNYDTNNYDVNISR